MRLQPPLYFPLITNLEKWMNLEKGLFSYFIKDSRIISIAGFSWINVGGCRGSNVASNGGASLQRGHWKL